MSGFGLALNLPRDHTQAPGGGSPVQAIGRANLSRLGP